MNARQSVTIRPAVPEDAALVLSLIRELADYEHLSNEVVADEESIRDVLFGPQAVAEALVGALDGVPVGFALFFYNCSTFLGRRGIYIEDVFVRPSARRSGVGKALLTHIAALAVERGCGRVEWSVLDWNQPAIDFYKGLGAQPMDEWTIFRLTGDALAKVAATAADPQQS